MSRVEGALGLIKTYDRIRHEHLVRDLERVRVWLLPCGSGSNKKSLRSCELDSRYVHAETSSLEMIASTIVHEATHARLMRCGIGYELELRARVEMACVRRQLAFAAKLPNADQVRESPERSLAFCAADGRLLDRCRHRRAICRRRFNHHASSRSARLVSAGLSNFSFAYRAYTARDTRRNTTFSQAVLASMSCNRSSASLRSISSLGQTRRWDRSDQSGQ